MKHLCTACRGVYRPIAPDCRPNRLRVQRAVYCAEARARRGFGEGTCRRLSFRRFRRCSRYRASAGDGGACCRAAHSGSLESRSERRLQKMPSHTQLQRCSSRRPPRLAMTATDATSYRGIALPRRLRLQGLTLETRQQLPPAEEGAPSKPAAPAAAGGPSRVDAAAAKLRVLSAGRRSAAPKAGAAAAKAGAAGQPSAGTAATAAGEKQPDERAQQEAARRRAAAEAALRAKVLLQRLSDAITPRERETICSLPRRCRPVLGVPILRHRRRPARAPCCRLCPGSPRTPPPPASSCRRSRGRSRRRNTRKWHASPTPPSLSPFLLQLQRTP